MVCASFSFCGSTLRSAAPAGSLLLSPVALYFFLTTLPSAYCFLLWLLEVVLPNFWATGAGTASGDGSEFPGMWGEAVDSTDGVSDLSLIRLSDAVAGRGLPLRLPRLVDLGPIKQEVRGLR